MPSPFPGMNPYLEQASVWTGFHNRFVTTAADMLTVLVDPAYFVEIDEHIYLHEWPVAHERDNVAVIGGTDEERISFFELRDRSTCRAITVIELLSRSYKCTGPVREHYLMKRKGILNREVNFVEIDLLRCGQRMVIANVPDSDYSVLVGRASSRPSAEYWAISIREPLPTIPIPLHADDADAVLNIQAILHHVYDSARYGSRIYSGKPEPILSPEDAAWAQQFVPPQA
jgi:Protein of unknown function (DUF4058)